MKFKKVMAIIFCAALMILVTACSKNEQTNGSISSRTQSSSSLVSQGASSSASISVSSKPISSAPTSVSSATKNSASKSISSVKNVTSKTSSKKSQSGSEWIAYSSSKDNYKLHIKRKDGTEDKVIVNDISLEPCVADGWVYYLPDLGEIDKVKLDGSQQTKVCSTDNIKVYDRDVNAYHGIGGSTSFTGEYKDGYILYKFVQMKQPGDNDKRPNPPSYYKLDLKQNKLIPVKK